MRGSAAAIVILVLLRSSAMAEEGPSIGPAPDGPLCPWIPVEESRLDALHCGFNDLSVPNTAKYECGKDLSCNNICQFKNCEP